MNYKTPPREFTLELYRMFLNALQQQNLPFLRFKDYIGSERDPAILLRHDVDRKPNNTLAMAKLESEFGIVSTYYFRARNHTFKPDLIKEVARMGHEIGYHYECLSDTNGDMKEAHKLFAENLAMFRKIVPIETISMHGSPLKPYDNRDMWRSTTDAETLHTELGVLGEIYLAIDYTNIAYISDTGRNWVEGRANRRDKVDSSIHLNFNSDTELLSYFSKPLTSTVVFQTHPERWSDSLIDWLSQAIKDRIINTAKYVLQVGNRRS